MAIKKEDKGMTTREKGVYIPPEKRVPYSPQYMHMSKADVLKAEEKRRENDLKAKQFRDGLEKDKEAEAPEKKKAGRPKRIE